MLASNRSVVIFTLISIPLLYIIGFRHAPLQDLKLFSSPSVDDNNNNNNTTTTTTTTNNSTIVDESEDTIIDENQQGAPRLRQASMIFADRENAVFERSLRTHLRHGNRWGYPTHILRQDALANKDFSKLVFNKIIYLQTLVIKELIKPPLQRSEWIL